MSSLTHFDAGNRYGIPYLWGTTGLGINVAQVKKALGDDYPLDSWSLLFDPSNSERLKNCGISILDAWDDVFPAVFSYLGEDTSTHDIKVFKGKAFDTLMALRPNLSTIHSSTYISDLVNGDVCLAFGYSGDK